MGQAFVFYCSRCEYQARVSGGPDNGFHSATQTILCLDCQTLHDVPVKLRVSDPATAPPEKKPPPKSLVSGRKQLLPEGIDATNILLFGKPPRTRWVNMKLRCPVAVHHRIEVWAAPGKCPRCGTFLERTLLPFRVWD